MRKPSPRRKQQPASRVAPKARVQRAVPAPVAGVMSRVHPRMTKALNDQVGAEMYAAHLYLSMSAYFQSRNLAGFAHWMRVQSQEEYGHAMKIYDYLVERDTRVILDEIAAPPTEWASTRAAFEDAHFHEQAVTDQFGRLVELSQELRDHATGIFLQWFVTEQVEEESQARQILEQFDLIGDARNLLFLLDRELGARSAGA
jgi:ferritin